jgi:hypothetical protein
MHQLLEQGGGYQLFADWLPLLFFLLLLHENETINRLKTSNMGKTENLNFTWNQIGVRTPKIGSCIKKCSLKIVNNSRININ